MAHYKIWFLQGEMEKKTRTSVNRVMRPAFRNAFYYVADRHPFLKKHYELKYEERCNEDLFVQKWLNHDTAGIFFVGHNRRGYPSLYHPSIDFQNVKKPSWNDWPVLNPKDLKDTLKGGNQNLCMLVLISCYSKSLIADWRALLPKRAWFEGFPSTTSGLKWLRRRPIGRRVDTILGGAAYLFERCLLSIGPAGAEPKKKESPWGIRCNLASASKLRGPIGREVHGRNVSSFLRRGPLGLT